MSGVRSCWCREPAGFKCRHCEVATSPTAARCRRHMENHLRMAHLLTHPEAVERGMLHYDEEGGVWVDEKGEPWA